MGFWAIFGIAKLLRYQLKGLWCWREVCSKSASGKSEGLTKAAAPEGKVSLGPSKSFLRLRFGVPKFGEFAHPLSPFIRLWVSSGISEPRLGQGSGLRSHTLVKYYPRQLSATGNTSQKPFPVGGSCSTAFAEGPEGSR